MNENKIMLVIIIIAIVLTSVVLINTSQPVQQDVARFSSQQELEQYLKAESQNNYYTSYSNKAEVTSAGEMGGTGSVAPSADSSRSGSDYSQTNVQVEGVDEPDIIKTDGQYIYAVTNTNLSIIDVSNAENASIVSTINLEGYGSQLFIAGDKLVVLTQSPMIYYASSELAKSSVIDGIRAPDSYVQRSQVKIYDISDRANPKEVQTIEYEGSYYNARLIGNYAYILVNQPLNPGYDGVPMPLIKYNGVESKIAATDISYFPIHDSGYQLTTIFAIDLDSDNEPIRSSFLTGYTQTIYVSQDNIYLASQKYLPYEEYQLKLIEKSFLPLVDSKTQDEIQSILDDTSLHSYDKQQKIQTVFEDYYNTLSQEDKDQLARDFEEKSKEAEAEIQKETQRTIIHKISIDKGSIQYDAKGEVPGTLLNQFSLDEYDNNLRVATTTGDTWSGSSLNHVYVLDDDLEIIGSVEDLAQGESIYSARFIGDRAYLVTFKQVDPFFVIDLSDPSNPSVLGKLKIPGYSNYLHPYDETHVIGIGKDTEGDIQEGEIQAAIPAGVKLALFDVSDPENPIELSKYVIGDRGTESGALWDHHAFLFDREKNLLVLPVSVRESSHSSDRWSYGPQTFEGAYVFSLDTSSGFQLKAKVTHLTPSEISMMQSQGDYSYAPYDTQVQRSLYIDNTLYTMSQRSIKATSLETYEDINTIKLPQQSYDYGIAYGGIAVDGVTSSRVA
jgi:uncharacterized secreted protein with C-terminal beta-propeller domain